jgi:hypothetical protein
MLLLISFFNFWNINAAGFMPVLLLGSKPMGILGVATAIGTRFFGTRLLCCPCAFRFDLYASPPARFRSNELESLSLSESPIETENGEVERTKEKNRLIDEWTSDKKVKLRNVYDKNNESLNQISPPTPLSRK